MEEKERYVIRYDLDYNRCLIDTEKNQGVGDYIQIVKLLNQQDKRIKELEEENNFLEKRNEELMIDRRDICLERNDIFEENQQLKQQLYDLPKKIVEEIKLQLFNHFKVKNIEEYEKLPLIDSLFTADTVIEILDTILKKYGGENE